MAGQTAASTPAQAGGSPATLTGIAGAAPRTALPVAAQAPAQTGAAAPPAASAKSAKAPGRDEFFWLGEINKATAVINTDEGLLDKSMAPRLAAAVAKVIQDGNQPGGKRPSTVITFEPLLIKAGGLDVTLLHAGRSSQDMHATYRAAILRDRLLELADQLNATATTLAEPGGQARRHHRSQLHQRRGRPAQ